MLARLATAVWRVLEQDTAVCWSKIQLCVLEQDTAVCWARYSCVCWSKIQLCVLEQDTAALRRVWAAAAERKARAGWRANEG